VGGIKIGEERVYSLTYVIWLWYVTGGGRGRNEKYVRKTREILGKERVGTECWENKSVEI